MEEFLALLDTILRTFGAGQSSQAFLVLLGLAFARLLTFLSIVPFFGGAAVSGRVKVATAASFVIIVFPTLTAGLPPGGRLPFGPIGFVALIIKEVFIGFTLGFVASLVFESIQMAGRIIDVQRGAALAELFAPQLQAPVSELGQFKLQLAIVLFLTTGAHRIFIAAMLRSFETIPALGVPKVAGLTPVVPVIVELSGDVIAIAVGLAAPGIVVLLMTDALFGVINRVAPQINVFFLSLPVKMAVGVLIVFLALPLLKDQFIHYFESAYRVFDYLLHRLAEAY